MLGFAARQKIPTLSPDAPGDFGEPSASTSHSGRREGSKRHRKITSGGYLMKRSNTIICIFLSLAICIPAFAVEKVYFVYTDPAGTPLAMTNADGAIVWNAEYKPFGEIYQEYAAPGFENNRMFVSKEMDVESGLYYFGARYMEARIGRFISPDPVGPVFTQTGQANSPMLETPQMLNSYAYAINNPYKYLDSHGKWPTRIHNRLIDLAFSSGKYFLDANTRDVLKAASKYVDRDANQGPGNANEHAMSIPDQTPIEAEAGMNKFIDDKINKYKLHMSKGDTDRAYSELGQALHTIMDSTSPSHKGFQVWGKYGEVENLESTVHVVREQYLNKNDRKITIDRMRNLFNKANQ